MKLHPVPARTGVLWVKLGIQTFFRQPLAMAGLFFLFLLVVMVLSFIPVIGQIASLMLVPAATLGLMAATREASSGRFPMPVLLGTAFRAGRDRMRAMLTLGTIYAVASVVIMGITALVIGDPMAELANESGEVNEAALDQPAVVQGLLLTLALYVPIGALFWHAPALVHWHGVSPVKSLFFSAMACWVNKGALVVYLLCWSGVFLGVSMAMVLLSTAFGGAALFKQIVFPLAMLMSSMFFSSLYFTFRDSFITDDEPAA